MGHDGHTPWTDQEWADQLMATEPNAVRAAWRWTGDPEEAKDIVHDVIARLFVKGPFTPDVSIEAFVLASVKNRCKDWHRKQARHPETSMTLDDGSTLDVEDGHPNALAVFLEEETRESIERALDELDPKLRHLLTLRYVAGLNLADIVTETGLSIGTVHNKLKIAVEQLIRILKRGEVHV